MEVDEAGSDGQSCRVHRPSSACGVKADDSCDTVSLNAHVARHWPRCSAIHDHATMLEYVEVQILPSPCSTQAAGCVQIVVPMGAWFIRVERVRGAVQI